MHESACDAVQSNGAVPPGNARNSPQQWVRKTPRAKPELKLTPGKGLQDLTCSVEDLLDTVVKSNKVCHYCTCQLLLLYLPASTVSASHHCTWQPLQIAPFAARCGATHKQHSNAFCCAMFVELRPR